MKKIASFLIAATLGVGCGSTSSSSTETTGSESIEPVTLTLLAHDSFTYPEGIFDAFTAQTGITVEVVLAGDAGELVTKAVLTSGNPEGDVQIGRAHV